MCSLCLFLGMLPVGLLPAKDLPAPTEAPSSLGGAGTLTHPYGTMHEEARELDKDSTILPMSLLGM